MEFSPPASIGRVNSAFLIFIMEMFILICMQKVLRSPLNWVQIHIYMLQKDRWSVCLECINICQGNFCLGTLDLPLLPLEASNRQTISCPSVILLCFGWVFFLEYHSVLHFRRMGHSSLFCKSWALCKVVSREEKQGQSSQMVSPSSWVSRQSLDNVSLPRWLVPNILVILIDIQSILLMKLISVKQSKLRQQRASAQQKIKTFAFTTAWQ